MSFVNLFMNRPMGVVLNTDIGQRKTDIRSLLNKTVEAIIPAWIVSEADTMCRIPISQKEKQEDWK